jgi:2-dehydropantoate 2-reductase
MKNVVIIGAGAMGSLYATLIARGGANVWIVDGWREHVEAIRSEGLRLSGISGDVRVGLAAYTWEDVDRIKERADLGIILVNANDTSRAASVAAKLLNGDGIALTLQNGIGNLEALTDRLSAPRVIGGLSYHSAAIVAPGHVEHTHRGPTWVGDLSGLESERVRAVASLLRGSGFEPTIVNDILAHIWTKFVHNSSINPICALLGIRVGEIPTTPGADAMQTEIIREALAIIEAKGIVLTEPDMMGAIKRFCRVKFNKPSMLQHMEARRPTEIDALNGAIVREGQALGIPTPYNTALTWMIKGLESRRIREAHEEPRDYAEMERQAKSAA